MEQSPIASAVLTAALAVIMFSLGTTLRGEQFRLVFTQPRGVLVGLANLLVLAPALAFAVAALSGVDAEFAIGLVLLGAAPGGVFANLLTHVARGATALSVSMTAISSALAVVTVPFWLSAALAAFDPGYELAFELTTIVLRVLAGIGIPLAAGMWLASRHPGWVAARRELLERIAVGTFAVIVVVAVASQASIVFEHLGELLLATVALNVAAMSLGFTIARAARLEQSQAVAISIELGIHNAALAVAIGAAVDERIAVPAAVYSAVMVGTGTAVAVLLRRRAASPQAA